MDVVVRAKTIMYRALWILIIFAEPVQCPWSRHDGHQFGLIAGTGSGGTDSRCRTGAAGNLRWHIYRGGNSVYRSGPSGRGPTESMVFSELFVDARTDRAFVYGALLEKIAVYGGTGACIDEITGVGHMFSLSDEVSVMNDGRLLANLVFSPELSDYYTIISSDSKLRTESFLLHYPYNSERLSHYAPMPKIAANRDGARSLSILSDTVYKVEDSRIVP